MRQFNVQKAKREKVYTKVALMGPSGAGKSYSSLRLSLGMAKELEKINGKQTKILFANSEGPRGRYYANEFDYDIIDLEPPFEPELYVDVINYATKEGYEILVIDSTSPEWEGEGGCLYLQQRAGGKYQDWSKVTPRHDKFIQSLAYSPIHIIATMRGKDQYEIEKDANGKLSVSKVGVGAKQREGFEYEFTCTFMLESQSNTAMSQKDNTHLFENISRKILTEEDGENIIKWANSDAGENTTARKFEVNTGTGTGEGTVTEDERLKSAIFEIGKLAESLAENGVDKKEIAETIKKHHTINGKKNANYNTISELEVATSVFKDLKSLAK